MLKYNLVLVLIVFYTRTHAQTISANFTPTNSCFNNPSCFIDQSVSNNGAINYWKWSFGDGATSSAQNPCHTYPTPGTYTVCLIVKNINNDADTACSSITINPLPVANFTSASVCVGDPTCFNSLSTISSGTITGWSWNFGDPSTGINNTSSQQSPCHTFSGLGPFNVTLTVTSGSGCQNITTQPVAVYDPPIAAFTASVYGDTVVVADASVPTSGVIATWYWDFGDGGTSSLQQPTHIYSVNGTYTICLIVTSNYGCKDTACKTITISSASVNEIDISSLVIISPNPTNGEFRVSSPEYKIQDIEIYNLIGEKLFSVDPNNILRAQESIINLVTPNGFYFLKIKMEVGTATKKIIIVKQF